MLDDWAAAMLRLTDAVHSEGTKVFQQLIHGGPTLYPQDGTSPWGASPVSDPGLIGAVVRPMTRWMMDEVIEGFVVAAQNARSGGVDGLEVHGGHGYIFSSFLSPATNRRTDMYGGPLENRVRFLCEVLVALRKALGEDYPLGVRLSSDNAPHQTTPEDVAQIAHILEERGLADWISLSLGSHWSFDTLMGAANESPGYQLEVNGAIADRISLPTMVAGRFGTIAQVEKVLASHNVDLVGMVRATIADPDLVRKTAEGRAHLIRPCIACNQACAGGIATKGRVSCTVNVQAGREVRGGDDSLASSSPRRILVIGGGPAGIEAARAGTLAGHTVTLLESNDQLGGQLQYAVKSPRRGHSFAKLLKYYPAMLADLGVDVHMGKTATADTVRSLAPDAVIVATGSVPRRDGFQALRPWGPPDGFDALPVLTTWDVMSGAKTSGTVVILDEVGHYETLDVAQLLVDQGRRVRLISRTALAAANLEGRWDVIAAPYVRYLYQGDFEFYPRRVITSVEGRKVTFERPEAPGRSESLDYDEFVVIGGNLPDFGLYEELRHGPWEVRLAGDANGPRMLEAATFEGNQAIRSLEPGWVRPSAGFGAGGGAFNGAR
ncbi:FAD-dependent oxidoreductase [Streptomyces sp. NPDC058171]